MIVDDMKQIVEEKNSNEKRMKTNNYKLRVWLIRSRSKNLQQSKIVYHIYEYVFKFNV